VPGPQQTQSVVPGSSLLHDHFEGTRGRGQQALASEEADAEAVYAVLRQLRLLVRETPFVSVTLTAGISRRASPGASRRSVRSSRRAMQRGRSRRWSECLTRQRPRRSRRVESAPYLDPRVSDEPRLCRDERCRVGCRRAKEHDPVPGRQRDRRDELPSLTTGSWVPLILRKVPPRETVTGPVEG